MKKQDIQYFFVDESGDSTFYNKRGNLIVGKNGCSPVLILGYITTSEPKELRKKLKDLQAEIIADKFYHEIPSFQKTKNSFHAKDDVPEIRKVVYEFISGLNFEAGFVVARKKDNIFKTKHKKNSNNFYFDIVSHLFKDIFNIHEKNLIYFSRKDSKNKHKLFENAIDLAKIAFEKNFVTNVQDKTEVFIQIPSEETCLQIIDYMNWAVYRAFVHREMRYYELIRHKVLFVEDLYSTAEENLYEVGNPSLQLDKIDPVK